MTGEQYLAEIGRIAKMVDRKEIDTFECANLLAKALSKRQAYLKKHPEVKTRPNPEKNVIIRRKNPGRFGGLAVEDDLAIL